VSSLFYWKEQKIDKLWKELFIFSPDRVSLPQHHLLFRDIQDWEQKQRQRN